MVEGEIVNKESIWWQDIMDVTHDHQLLNVLQNREWNGCKTFEEEGTIAREAVEGVVVV